MPQTINTNLVSLNAQRNLSGSQGSLATSMQRLSSGLRVNSAKDDAAGLAIAERMQTQIKGMNVAVRNANDGISMMQTAEGATAKIGDMLQRMRELAVQSVNGTNNSSDQANLDAEFQQLTQEIGRTLSNTSFNGTKVLTNSASLEFQVGANVSETISVSAVDLSSGSLAAATTGQDILSASTANLAISAIDLALTQVNDTRATFGAVQNRFDSAISVLQTAAENQSAARSRIMDADFAAETASLSRAQVLQQAGNAMVAQANQLPQQVLKLLQG